MTGTTTESPLLSQTAKRAAAGALLLLLFAIAPAAFAGDGRLEIHQACVAAGCFAGDGPGFPIETEAGRSYVLTSSLSVPDVDTRAVWLRARSVLDLNGFEIAGPTTCSGAPATCSAAGAGEGVYAEDHATIRNGTVRGMGNYGIAGEVGVTVENMLVQGNAGVGLFLLYGNDGPEAHLVRGARVIGNGSHGIHNAGGQGGIGTLVTDCVVHGNRGYGLLLMNSQVTNSTISRSQDEGIYGTNTAVGGSTFLFNNGGNDQPQTVGSLLTIGTNICGIDTSCP